MLEALPAMRAAQQDAGEAGHGCAAGRRAGSAAAAARARAGCGRFFPPEPQVLQEGEGELAQQGVVVQPAPAPPLEVAQPELALSCWCICSQHPPRLDQVGQASSEASGGRFDR
jgi:hypothetical protein